MQRKALKSKHAQLQREESCRRETSLLNVKFLETCMSYETKTSEELGNCYWWTTCTTTSHESREFQYFDTL